jgi:hypothetical protein
MPEYRWIEDCPDYEISDNCDNYVEWLTDNIGPRVWDTIGYPRLLQYELELDNWAAMFASMLGSSDLESMRSYATKTIGMYEGVGWKIINATWLADSSVYFHASSFYLYTESDAALVHFKLACL